MRRILLEKTRLSEYFIIFFLFYTIIVILLPDIKFDGGALTLFSVNSFLYGFYIAPILAAQKARIEDLHRIVRAEANAIFAMVISIKKMPKTLRNQLQDMFITYLRTSIRQRKPAEGEENYEKLITFCLEYKGEHQAEIDKLLEKLVANQQNRTNFAMQITNRVFSNEWMIMLVLFTITLSFVLLLDAGDGYLYQFLAAFLCTGLTMLLIILVKMSTLTHKKAKQVWDPYKKLIDSHFYRID
ncbi:MAG: hypothetical protein JWP13_534 [Candidatus Saccharibacteria bacterium]|nr:hypothetical protein [Candidatus Saccharibacteria bacterium]